MRWTALLFLGAASALYPALIHNVGAFSHDAGTAHLYRSYVFSGAISEGALYPRWVQFLHWGLGSPLFTFNPPAPYYALDGLFRLGIPHPVGWRLLLAAGLLAAAAGAYLFTRQLTSSKLAALVAAMAFLYAPYVLRNAFERGSLEVFGMFLYPWVLWGLLRLARQPSAMRLLAASLLWAACIASHVLAPLMLAPFAALIGVASTWHYRTAVPLAALVAGGLLTAFIWLPIAPERDWVHIDRIAASTAADPAAQPVPGDQLLAGPAVYDIMRDGNLPSRGVGWPHLAALLLGLPGAIYAWSRGRRNLAILLAASTLAGLALLWMLSSASDFFWQALRPILTFLEFRVRLMGLLALVTAVSAGLLVALLPPRWQTKAAAVVAAILILLAWPSLYVNLQHKYGDFDDRLDWEIVRQAEIKSGGSAFTSWGEFLPRWRTEPFDRALLDQISPNFDPRQRPLLDPPAGLSVVSERIDSSRWDLAVEAARPATLTLALLYYPRWQATLDGEPATLRPQEGSGYVQLDAPQGNFELALRYRRTLAETLGLITSLVTLAALVGWAIRGKHAQVNALDQRKPRREDVWKDQALPSGWLLIGLAAILVVKWLVVDPSTTLFRCQSTAEQVCGAEATVDVPFVGGHRLRGYTVPSYRVKAGEVLRVDLFWQAEPGLDRPLHSFVHIRNSQPEQATEPITGSEIWAQQDHINPAGLFTSEFMPGKLYYDEMRVAIPETMPAGEYFLEIGWFDPATGEQLEPVADAVEPPLGILWRSILLPSVTIIE